MRARGSPNCGYFRSNETTISTMFDTKYLFRQKREREIRESSHGYIFHGIKQIVCPLDANRNVGKAGFRIRRE